MGAPPNTSPTLVQGNIGQLGTMIDLLNASGQCSPPSALCSPTEPAIFLRRSHLLTSAAFHPAAHDPDHHYDSDDSSSDTDELVTPGSSHDGHPHTFVPSAEAHSRPAPKRGDSIYTGKAPQEQQMAIDMALDGLDSVDDAISRAQDQEDEEDFADPRESLDQRTPEEMLATLVEEYGPWTDDSEEFQMQVRCVTLVALPSAFAHLGLVSQVPGALYRGVLIKGLLALTNRRFFVYAFVPPPEGNNKVIKVSSASPVPRGRAGSLTASSRFNSLDP